MKTQAGSIATGSAPYFSMICSEMRKNMIYNTFEMHQEGSLPGAHLVTYIQEYSDAMAINDRPLILLCPGGGYTRTSDREAEPMALKFLAMGYHAAVLRYSCAHAK